MNTWSQLEFKCDGWHLKASGHNKAVISAMHSAIAEYLFSLRRKGNYVYQLAVLRAKHTGMEGTEAGEEMMLRTVGPPSEGGMYSSWAPAPPGTPRRNAPAAERARAAGQEAYDTMPGGLETVVEPDHEGDQEMSEDENVSDQEVIYDENPAQPKEGMSAWVEIEDSLAAGQGFISGEGRCELVGEIVLAQICPACGVRGMLEDASTYTAKNTAAEKEAFARFCGIVDGDVVVAYRQKMLDQKVKEAVAGGQTWAEATQEIFGEALPEKARCQDPAGGAGTPLPASGAAPGQRGPVRPVGVRARRTRSQRRCPPRCHT